MTIGRDQRAAVREIREEMRIQQFQRDFCELCNGFDGYEVRSGILEEFVNDLADTRYEQRAPHPTKIQGSRFGRIASQTGYGGAEVTGGAGIGRLAEILVADFYGIRNGFGIGVGSFKKVVVWTSQGERASVWTSPVAVWTSQGLRLEHAGYRVNVARLSTGKKIGLDVAQYNEENNVFRNRENIFALEMNTR
ncbi:hypothetical protein M5K25_016095 [Dendrobium thyrsiflorum]|uniref:Nudix hydrolase domain-containing protein n=1 Tax=Dendrobium thyrsiflorum TaxID=117978 RepID=A0ABD0US65_DENTH